MHGSARRLAVLLVAAVTARHAPTATQSDDDSPKKAEAKKFAGAWVLRADERGGASSADDSTRSKLIELYPHFFTLKGGEYKLEHSNLAVSEVEEGTFEVVRVGEGFAEVDVSATLRVRGDGPPRPERKFVRNEIWRLADGDTLQRCLPADPDAKGRPAGFKTKKGDGLVLMTFKKRKG